MGIEIDYHFQFLCQTILSQYYTFWRSYRHRITDYWDCDWKQ